MKRTMILTALALLFLSGFGNGLWADEQCPPPNPGLGGEVGIGGGDEDEPDGDDHPWGGEERVSGDQGGASLDSKLGSFSITPATGDFMMDFMITMYQAFLPDRPAITRTAPSKTYRSIKHDERKMRRPSARVVKLRGER